MMKWKKYNTIISTNITTIWIYVYQPLTAADIYETSSSRPLSVGYLIKKKKKKVEACKYFQCKPTRGWSGTIEPKHLADTPQICVHGNWWSGRGMTLSLDSSSYRRPWGASLVPQAVLRMLIIWDEVYCIFCHRTSWHGHYNAFTMTAQGFTWV